MNKQYLCKRRMAGFTLIEVLVSMVVIAFGMLGMAATQLKGQQAAMDAYQRAQALILTQDMVNRINANRKTAGCYIITTGTTSGQPFAGHGNTTSYSCSAYGTPATQAVADDDLAAWDGLLKGQTETLSGGTDNVGGLIGARGCISYDAPNDTYTVAVAWQGLSATEAPTNTCASGLYGEETRRRVVSTTFRIAQLD